MSYVGGPGRFKKEWYGRIPVQEPSYPVIKKVYYIKARTAQKCLYINENFALSDKSKARMFSADEEFLANVIAQILNKADNTYRYEVFGVSKIMAV